MGKIRPYIPPEEGPFFFVTVIHFSPPDRFGPGAWHCIWWYIPEDLYPGAHVWAFVDTAEHGAIMAQSWASMPAMINDACVYCRAYDYGPAIPRWNIYRGQEQARGSYDPSDSDARIIPCFAQPYWDPSPPGFV